MSSWLRMMFLGNVGQQLDIDDVEADVERLRARQHSQARVDQSQDEALLTLRRELDDLTLVVAELSRLVVAGGTLPADSVERIVRALEKQERPARPPVR